MQLFVLTWNHLHLWTCSFIDEAKYEGYSESNLHLFLATNVGVWESSCMW
jgi:hypothetical protein